MCCRRGPTLDCNVRSQSEAQSLKEGTRGSPRKDIAAHRGWRVMRSSTERQDAEKSFWQASLFLLMTTFHPPAGGSRTFSPVDSKRLPSNCGFSSGWRNAKRKSSNREANQENPNPGRAGLLEAEQRAFLPDTQTSPEMNHQKDKRVAWESTC